MGAGKRLKRLAQHMIMRLTLFILFGTLMTLSIVAAPAPRADRVILLMDPRLSRSDIMRSLAASDISIIGFGAQPNMVVITKADRDLSGVTGYLMTLSAAGLRGCEPAKPTPHRNFSRLYRKE